MLIYLFIIIFLYLIQVGVHNGWTFVSEPHMVYLEPEYEGGGSKSGRKSPSPASQGSLRSMGEFLLYVHCVP